MRSKVRLVIAAMGILELAGCSSIPNAVNPVSWYRNITGISKDDNLGKNQNQQNYAEGGKEPYPNLGTVPNAPDTAMSGINRANLANSLIADRNHAQYLDENLHAGTQSGIVVPPPAAAPVASASTTAATPASSGTSTPATPTAPPAKTASAAPTGSTPAPPAAAPAATNAAPVPSAPAATPAPAESAPAAAMPTPPPPAKPAATPAPTKTASQAPVRGSEAPPAESPLTSPTMPSVPQGEAIPPVPPVPQIPPPNTPAAMTPPAAPATPAPGPAAASNTTGAIHLIPPPPATASAGAAPMRGSRPSVSYEAAAINFSVGSTKLAEGQQAKIAEIVKLHNENGGTIRIVGHGQARGSNAAVAGLNLALGRAQTIAAALADHGVPAQDIAVDTAPVSGGGGADVPRAEIYIEN